MHLKSSPFGRGNSRNRGRGDGISIGVLVVGDPPPAAGTENVVLGVHARINAANRNYEAQGALRSSTGVGGGHNINSTTVS